MKAKPKQRRSKDKESSKQPSVSEVQSKAFSPSGEISSSQDSVEESTCSQDSLQISARWVHVTLCVLFKNFLKFSIRQLDVLHEAMKHGVKNNIENGCFVFLRPIMKTLEYEV